MQRQTRNASRNLSRQELPAEAFALQNLESRQLMSAAPHAVPVPLTVTSVATPQGRELCITGAAGNNTIIVDQTSAGFVVKNSTGWKHLYSGHYKLLLVTGGDGGNIIKLEPSVTIPATLRGGAGNDTLYAGSGPDELIGGPRKNILVAGKGNDTLVTIGSRSDTLEGGSGLDSFWADDKSTEILRHVTTAELTAGAVHRIASFMETATSSGETATPDSLAVTKLPEPAVDSFVTAWADYSSDPLFPTGGPSENDINQGSTGDCYLLSTLSAVAKTDPQVIRQSVVSLGDGTYAVRFFQNGNATYVRVDGELPEYWAGSGPAYAGLGQQSSVWVAIMEKAWAGFDVTGSNSYDAISGGWMATAYNALGFSSSDDWSFDNATDMATYIQQSLAAGDIVTYATLTDTAQLIGEHAYTVDSVVTNSSGTVTGITLRNPWGAQAGNNGYVTVTPADLLADLCDVCVG